LIPVLLDTNAYLRLAKRVRPMLGVSFGAKEYSLTILTDVETEVHRNPSLKFKFPWFDDQVLVNERLATIFPSSNASWREAKEGTLRCSHFGHDYMDALGTSVTNERNAYRGVVRCCTGCTI
jgi:hypothetical protein